MKAARRRARLDWSGIGGIAFVGLVALGLALGNQLDSHKSKGEFARYYNDFRGSAHEWRELLATFLVFIAAFCFAWFLRRLYTFVRPVDDGLAVIAVGGGFVAVTLLIAAFVASTAVGTTLTYSDDYRVELDTAILMSNVALFLYTGAAAGAAVMIWATSLAARRGAPISRWLAWSGFGVAIACLAMTALDGLSLVLLLAWVLVLSVLFLRRGWSAAEAGGTQD
jgi:hypothetical protein